MDMGSTERGLLFILIAIMSGLASLTLMFYGLESDPILLVLNAVMLVSFILLTVIAALLAVIELWPT